MAGHTPGPWRVTRVESKGTLVYASIDSAGDGPVGFAGTYLLRKPVEKALIDAECEANARLIAAAPDLLALVKELQWTQDSETGLAYCAQCHERSSLGHATTCPVGYLIAKAEGRA